MIFSFKLQPYIYSLKISIVPTIDWFEKHIIEKLIERSRFKSFEIGNKIEFFKSFGVYKHELNLTKAFDNLVEKKLLFQIRLGYYKLNAYEFISEIRRIKNIEPIGTRSKEMLPMDKYFTGYIERFTLTTQNSWPHRGTYYCCTKKEDNTNWKIIFRANPTKNPRTYYFGSFLDNDSTVLNMWKTIVKVWKKNNQQPVYKKMAEDANQTDFGNNRQAGTAAFEIFRKFGWIHEVSKKGKQIFYQIDKPDEYLDIINKKIPICPRCGLPAPSNFCMNCNLPV